MATKAGKPTTFDAEIVEEILDRVAAGETLRAICSEDKFPPASTFCTWVVANREGISERYARARELQCEAWADVIREQSRKCQLGEKTETDANGAVVKITTGDTVDRSRLEVDSLKWLLSKLKPKQYGDRIENQHTGTLTVVIAKPEVFGEGPDRPAT